MAFKQGLFPVRGLPLGDEPPGLPALHVGQPPSGQVGGRSRLVRTTPVPGQVILVFEGLPRHSLV